jgi:predicted alpha/beta hydrolase
VGLAVGAAQRCERGEEAVASDLPTDRRDVTSADCVAAVADAVGDADDVVVVGQSAGGFAVPLVAERVGGAAGLCDGHGAGAWRECG